MKQFFKKIFFTVLGLTLTGLMLVGCAVNPGKINTFKKRHPIVLGTKTYSTVLDIGTRSAVLSVSDRRRLQELYSIASDVMGGKKGDAKFVIWLPESQPDLTYASFAKVFLTVMGASEKSVVFSRYRKRSKSNGYQQNLPIVVSIKSGLVAGIADDCGYHPNSSINLGFFNKEYYNFGCASQSNLAAMIQNPLNLIAPYKLIPRRVSAGDSKNKKGELMNKNNEKSEIIKGDF